MLRTRDFLIVSIPAALLAFAVQPLVGAALAPAAAAPSAVAHVAVPDDRPAPADLSRRAEEPPTAPTIRPRPRVGCEGAISSLAGAEARRLLPSRCLV